MIPIRITTLLEHWLAARKHGRVVIVFKGGGIPHVEIDETVRVEDLPAPPIFEDKKVEP